MNGGTASAFQENAFQFGAFQAFGQVQMGQSEHLNKRKKRQDEEDLLFLAAAIVPIIGKNEH